MTIEDRLDRIESALRIRIPFISSLVRKCRIVKTDSDNLPGAVGVSENGWLVINPNKFREMEFRDQCFVIAHGAMHIVNLHNRRGVDKNKMVWNFAADASVNHLLDSIMNTPQDVVSLRTVAKIALKLDKNLDLNKLEKMADFEIYENLPKPSESGGQDSGGDGNVSGGEGGKGKAYSNNEKAKDDPSRGPNGEGDLLCQDPDGMGIIQDGAGFNNAEYGEKKERWNKALSKAAMDQKLAGDMPAGLERYVDDILKPDLDIKSLIKQFIQNGIGALKVNNWRRTSRKHPLLPGTKMLSTPTIWCLVDTSGSIGDEELELFLGTAYEFASRGEIRVIPWDAGSYEVLEARNKSQVMEKVGKKLEGGGGTKIIPPLEKVQEEMTSGDVVSVMTDGFIFDADENRAKELFDNVNSMSSSCFICTTEDDVNVTGWKCLNIGQTI